jgi:hypothetical protein
VFRGRTSFAASALRLEFEKELEQSAVERRQLEAFEHFDAAATLLTAGAEAKSVPERQREVHRRDDRR